MNFSNSLVIFTLIKWTNYAMNVGLQKGRTLCEGEEGAAINGRETRGAGEDNFVSTWMKLTKRKSKDEEM